MVGNCWICEKKAATTGEHAIMKAAYERVLGRLAGGEKAFFSYIGGNQNIPVGSYGNDRLKFAKSICGTCNGSLTQPYDSEFLSFVEYLQNTKSLIISRNSLSLRKFNRTNLALYFIKIFGCLVKDLKRNILEVDYQQVRQSILQGRVLTKNIYLSAHRDLGKLAAKGTSTIAHYPVFASSFCAWIIDLDWLSFIISYPVCPVETKYGTQWNLSDDMFSLKLGKLR